MANKFQPLVSKDRTVTLIQQNLNTALDPISTNPIVQGKYVSVSAASLDTDIAVNHNLGTAQVGWHVGNCSQPLSVYNGSKATTKQTLFVRVSSSVQATAKNPHTFTLYVYPLSGE